MTGPLGDHGRYPGLQIVNEERTRDNRPPSCLSRAFWLLLGIFLLVFFTMSLYRPDRDIPMIVPGSSGESTFNVQIIRPREGLPLGGLLPPQYFGADADLGFDSTGEAASYNIENNLLELRGDDWEVRLIFDNDGQIDSESEIFLNIKFRDQVRRVRCSPGDSVVGVVELIDLEGSNELSGRFELELPICDDAETGNPLGWPPKPFVLRGSFDRLQK